MNINLNLGEIIIQNAQQSSRVLPLSRMKYKKYINPQIVEECLNTLDIFRGLFEGMPHQQNRVIRDVTKGLEVQQLSENQIIYKQGEKAKQIYLVLNGIVSACITEVKQVQNSDGNQIEEVATFKEIDAFEKGLGFGEGQFAEESIRRLTMMAKTNETIIGKLEVSSFEEVLQNYRQRVYYRKRDMFYQCPLFNYLGPIKMDFIINNAKPATFSISQKIVRQGQTPKTLFLINKGQISLYVKKNESRLKQYSSALKMKSVEKKQKVMLGVLNEGNFIGDLEFALNKSYSFNAICSTEKAQVYYCDYRIIMSQMSPEDLKRINFYYQSRQLFNMNKIIKYNQASQIIERKKRDLLPPMNKEQINIKRRLMHRYAQKKPTLIGYSTPLDIMKMIKRKEKRVEKMPEEDKNNPQIELLDNHTLKRSKYKSPDQLSPLLKIRTPTKKQRFATEPNLNSSPLGNPEDSYESLRKGKSSLTIEKKIKNSSFLNHKKDKIELEGRAFKFKTQIKSISQFDLLINKSKRSNS